jgi:hypothetical protein
MAKAGTPYYIGKTMVPVDALENQENGLMSAMMTLVE